MASPGSKGGGSGIDFCLFASPFLLFVIVIYIFPVASLGITTSFYQFYFAWIMMIADVIFGVVLCFTHAIYERNESRIDEKRINLFHYRIN